MEQSNQIIQVKIEDIIPNRFQPRLNFKEEELHDLAKSVKQYGIIQPLILRTLGDKYEIIAGERRYKAATMVGLKTVPAVINNIDDQTSAELAIVENVQRQDLSAIEEAKSYKRLLDLGQMTQEQLAERMGKKQATIANKIRLLNLPMEVQNALLEGKISERHARTLLQVPDINTQKEILEEIISKKLTVKATEVLIKEKLANKPDILEEINDNPILEKKEPKINLNELNNPTISKNNIFDIIGDEEIMNQPNYNDLMQQPAQPIPETPIPNSMPTPESTAKNSIFNNNFFPSLDDEKTNINLNPWSIPQEPENHSAPEITSFANPSSGIETPWNMPQEPTVQPNAPEVPSFINQPPVMENPNPWSIPQEPAVQPNAPEMPSFMNQPPVMENPNPWNMPQEPAVQPNAPELPSFMNQPPVMENVNPWSIPQEPAVQPNAPELPSFMNQPPVMENPNPWNLPQESTDNLPSFIDPSFAVENPNPWNMPQEPMVQPSTPEIPSFMNQPSPQPSSMIFAQDLNNPQIQTPNPEPKYNINDSINKVRNTISEIENMGYKVQSSEIDMDTEYQIIIKIQKAGN